MGYRISTPLNVMLYETKEVPLKLRFNLLTRKFLIKCLARKFNPVIESLDALRLAARHRSTRIHLLCSFPIFRHFIYISHYRNTVHSSPFLPQFFYDLDTYLFAIQPCMTMFPINQDLSPAVIQNMFYEKSLPYRDNTVSFYTDDSKLNKDVPSGVGVYSPDLNLCITHKLPPETSIFTAEAWAILLTP